MRGIKMMRTWVIAGLVLTSRYDVGAGSRCRRAGVQAILLPLPPDRAARQHQARSTAQRDRRSQGWHVRRLQLLTGQQIFRYYLERRGLRQVYSRDDARGAWHTNGIRGDQE